MMCSMRLEPLEWFVLIAGTGSLALAITAAAKGGTAATVYYSLFAVFALSMTAARVRRRRRGDGGGLLTVLVTGIFFTGWGVWAS